MLPLPEMIEPLFMEAGWVPHAKAESVEPGRSEAERRAAEIVASFGGLRVGNIGPGTEQATSDVHFYSTLRPEVGSIAEPWASIAGKCEAFATAHHDHIVVLVNGEGTYFAFSDADGHLYALGSTFGEAMRKLLWGYSYGAPLARDA